MMPDPTNASVASFPFAEASRQFMQAANRLPAIAPLYTLAEEFNRLVDLLQDAESDPVEVEAQLVHVTSDIKAKAFGIAEVIRSFERRAEEYKREQDRLYAERKAVESAVERLKAYALAQMQSIGVDRIDAGVHTVRIQANPPKAEVTDEAAVPGQFKEIRTTVHIDLAAIKKWAKETGEVVPGVTIERGVSLRIS